MLLFGHQDGMVVKIICELRQEYKPCVRQSINGAMSACGKLYIPSIAINKPEN